MIFVRDFVLKFSWLAVLYDSKSGDERERVAPKIRELRGEKQHTNLTRSSCGRHSGLLGAYIGSAPTEAQPSLASTDVSQSLERMSLRLERRVTHWKQGPVAKLFRASRRPLKYAIVNLEQRGGVFRFKHVTGKDTELLSSVVGPVLGGAICQCAKCSTAPVGSAAAHGDDWARFAERFSAAEVKRNPQLDPMEIRPREVADCAPPFCTGVQSETLRRIAEAFGFDPLDGQTERLALWHAFADALDPVLPEIRGASYAAFDTAARAFFNVPTDDSKLDLGPERGERPKVFAPATQPPQPSSAQRKIDRLSPPGSPGVTLDLRQNDRLDANPTAFMTGPEGEWHFSGFDVEFRFRAEVAIPRHTIVPVLQAGEFAIAGVPFTITMRRSDAGYALYRVQTKDGAHLLPASELFRYGQEPEWLSVDRRLTECSVDVMIVVHARDIRPAGAKMSDSCLERASELIKAQELQGHEQRRYTYVLSRDSYKISPVVDGSQPTEASHAD